MHNKIDHFAIGAQTLEQGTTFVKEKLGVDIPRGGKHDAMSTHNCVAQCTAVSGEETFLEIIAIDPDAPDPGRTRWFTLDDPATQARLIGSPGALCWVVGTDDLDGVIAASPVDLGEVVTFTRGDRSWRLTVPQDGSLPMNGLLPAFIEWSPGPHPSTNMQQLGLELSSIVLRHPEPDKLRDILGILQIEHLANVTGSVSSSLSLSLAAPGPTLFEIED